MGRVVILFHHILNEDKREYIISSALELALAGWSRTGTPGIIFAEGAPDRLQELVDRLRALRWQSMELAAYETAPSRAIESLVFEEVESMSAVARGASAHGLERLLEEAQAGTGWANAVAAFGGVAKMEYHEKRAMQERQRCARTP